MYMNNAIVSSFTSFLAMNLVILASEKSDLCLLHLQVNFLMFQFKHLQSASYNVDACSFAL